MDINEWNDKSNTYSAAFFEKPYSKRASLNKPKRLLSPKFMSLLKDIDSEGYTFKVTPLVSYFIRDNISIGGRLAYSRSYTKLDNLSLPYR